MGNEQIQKKPGYYFDETCQLTVPATIICFLESRDYADCLKLTIVLGGDADTLATIAGPMAYAFSTSQCQRSLWRTQKRSCHNGCSI